MVLCALSGAVGARNLQAKSEKVISLEAAYEAQVHGCLRELRLYDSADGPTLFVSALSALLLCQLLSPSSVPRSAKP